MMKIQLPKYIFYILKISLLYLPFGLLSCSAKGPVLPTLNNTVPAPLSGNYRFTPRIRLYKNSQLGQLSFKKMRVRGVDPHYKTLFSLQVLGQLKNGAVRIRKYIGTAVIHRGILELQSKRCYLFGKKYWEDKLKPLKRFDCDHLVFQFQSHSKFQKRDMLHVYRSDRTRFSDWFPTGEITPMPGLQIESVFFTGQILYLNKLIEQDFRLQTKNGEIKAPLDNYIKSKIKQADVIVWGMGGSVLLRDKQELIVLDAQGRDAGTLEVVSRPGDTVLCRWKKRSKRKGVITYTNKNKRFGKSLF